MIDDKEETRTCEVAGRNIERPDGGGWTFLDGAEGDGAVGWREYMCQNRHPNRIISSEKIGL